MVDSHACCSHLNIEYDPIDNNNGTMTSRWTCTLCKKSFVPSGAFEEQMSALIDTWSPGEKALKKHNDVLLKSIQIQDKNCAELSDELDIVKGDNDELKDLIDIQAQAGVTQHNQINDLIDMVERLEKEISVEDMQKIVDANEKLVKEMKDR